MFDENASGGMLPANIALMVGEEREWKREVVGKVLKSGFSLKENILQLGRMWALHLWFKNPIKVVTVVPRKRFIENGRNCIVIGGRREVEKTNHVFNGFFESKFGGLCYTLRSNSRTGYYFQRHWYELIDKYEVVVPGDTTLSLDKFAVRFDRRFITDSEINNLWSHNSSQHGGKYNLKDFKRLGSVGKQVMGRFLKNFKGVTNTDSTGYRSMDNEHYLSEYRHSFSRNHFGRDIKIEHRLGNDSVWYSSELPGCGNGSYGLIANKHEWLHLEDD